MKKREPITDFNTIKEDIEEIGKLKSIEEIFKELSEALALVENNILIDNTNSEVFKENMGNLIVSYLSLLSIKYNIDDLYDFLNSRKHWGIYKNEYFKNKKLSLVIPFYKLRVGVSDLIIDNNSGASVKSLFDLTAYLIYIEED